MNRRVTWILLPFGAVSLLAATPAAASWYALIIGAQGTDQGVFAGDVTAVAPALTSGRWTGYDLPGHTRTLCSAGCPAVASTANIAAQLRAIDALMAADGDRNKYLLFYFAGHGDDTRPVSPTGNGGEQVPPALDTGPGAVAHCTPGDPTYVPCGVADEYIIYDLGAGPVIRDHVDDDALPGVLAANVPNATDVLFVVDACHSGGLWNGIDPPGDLETVRNAFLIASAQEYQHAPLVSVLRPGFVNELQTRRRSFTGKQMAKAIGYQNLSFTGRRRQSTLDPFTQFETDQQFDSFDIGPNGDAVFFDAAGSFGGATASCDFDGDGFADVATGGAAGDVDTVAEAGSVSVLYGTANGLSSTGRQTFDQNRLAVSGGAEEGDRFGAALAAGDFNGDGFCDLAIGAPDEDVGTIVDAGAVTVLYGSRRGLSSAQVWDQNKPFIEGAAEAGDHLGAALAAGDFDGDGFADLAIGVPGEDVGTIPDAGAVNVLYGSRSKLSASHDQLWDQTRIGGSTSEAGDHFGAALGAGDFNGDGFDDLAIGAPDEDVGKAVDAGAVAILYGSRLNLSAAGSQTWSQSTTGVEGISETGDEFGSALAAADFDGDGFADLAIGIPGENGDAGAVEVLYGTRNSLSAAHDQVWDQNRSGVEGAAERGDRFGAAVTGGDFDHDGFADLAVGVPGESIGGASRAGAVNVLYGTRSGVSTANDQEWEQGKGGVKGGPDTDDAFGAAVAAGDFNGDGFADLAIGVPGENNGAGALNVLYGTANDLSAAGNDLFQ